MDLATAGGLCLLCACMCFISCFYVNFSDDQDADEQKDDVKYENGSDNFIPFAINVKIVPECLIIAEEKSSVQHKHVIISNNETNILNV